MNTKFTALAGVLLLLSGMSDGMIRRAAVSGENEDGNIAKIADYCRRGPTGEVQIRVVGDSRWNLGELTEEEQDALKIIIDVVEALGQACPIGLLESTFRKALVAQKRNLEGAVGAFEDMLQQAYADENASLEYYCQFFDFSHGVLQVEKNAIEMPQANDQTAPDAPAYFNWEVSQRLWLCGNRRNNLQRFRNAGSPYDDIELPEVLNRVDSWPRFGSPYENIDSL